MTTQAVYNFYTLSKSIRKTSVCVRVAAEFKRAYSMKQLYILALGAALLSLMACSDSDDDKSPQPAATASAPQTQQTQQPATKLNPAQQQAIDDAKGMPKQGVVKTMLHSSGYTYMDVDTGNDKSVWIAAAMMRIKIGDTIKWTDAAVMRDFKSSSLHRTFDEILFVSNASVAN